MEVILKEIEADERIILENLFHYYIYDMSEFFGLSPDESGTFKFRLSQFDIYWKRDDHVPYFIYCHGELAGFVLVRKYPPHNDVYDIEQFFVLRKFKRQGIGTKALSAVVDLFPGRWQIRVLKENVVALGFWQSAVSHLVGDDYQLSKDIDVDLEMHFIRFQVLSNW